MSRRRVAIMAVIGLSILGAVAVALALFLPQPGVTKRNFNRVHEGMSVEEVEAILGPHAHNAGKKLVWHAEREGSEIVIVLDTNGRVSHKTFVPVEEEPPSMVRKLINLIPWFREEPEPESTLVF